MKKLCYISAVLLCVIYVCFGQQQDMRRGGAAGGGVSVAAGTRMTASTNGSVVTLSTTVSVAAGTNTTVEETNGVFTVSTSGGGLFYNGVSSINSAMWSATASDMGKLIVNSTTSGSVTIGLPSDMEASIAVGSYVYLHFTGSGVGGSITSSGSVTVFGSGNSIGGRYAMIKCYKVAADTWHIEGDLTIP